MVFNILSIIERGSEPKFSVDVVKYNPLWADKLRWLMKKSGLREYQLYEVTFAYPGREKPDIRSDSRGKKAVTGI